MGALDSVLGGGHKQGGGAFGAVLGGSGAPPGDVSALEAQAEAAGTPDIPQESPGLFRRTIDLLSRGNYAVAGFVDEALQGHTPLAQATRAGRELFSGVGGIKGEKRAFGEVLERAGVPELGSIQLEARDNPLSGLNKVLPPSLTPRYVQSLLSMKAPEATVTGRGAIGFGLDVLTDPLNLVSFGEEAAARKLLVSGAERTLSKAGTRELAAQVVKRLPRTAEGAIDLAKAPLTTQKIAVRAARSEAAKMTLDIFRDDVARDLISQGIKPGSRIHAAVQSAVDSQVAERIAAAAATDPSLLDQGGMKLLGHTVPGTPAVATMASGVSAKAIEAIGKTKYGASALEGARLARQTVEGLFNRDVLGKEIPGYLTEKQRFYDHQALLDATLKERARASDMMLLRDPKRFKDIADRFEARGPAALTGNEQKAMAAFDSIMVDIANGEISRGLLSKDARREWYFAHFYENPPEEIAKVVAAYRPTRMNGANIGRHAEERAFPTLKEAVRWTTEKHAIDPSIPILRPIYDPFQVIGKRIETHSQAVAFHDFYDAIASKYGSKLAFSPQDYYDLTKGTGYIPPHEYKLISDRLALGRDHPRYLQGLTANGRAEFLRQRVARVASRDELFRVIDRYHGNLGDFPKQVALLGTPSADGSAYMRLTGVPALAEYDLPGSIAQDLSKLANYKQTAEWVLAARPLLNGYDRINNLFKSGVTWLFPAFHFRNAYTNVAQAFADIGVSAINPLLHRDTVALLAGRGGALKTWAGQVIPYDDIRKLMDEYQIKVSGRQALEFTGDTGIRRGIADKAAFAAGGIETEARAQLFMSHLRRGLPPEQAAARVKSVLFDYANLSEFEKRVMRRAIPFYTWTRKNIALQVDNLIHRPGLTALQVKPFRGRDAENGEMTSWEGEALKLRLDRDGRNVTVLTGIDLPIKDLDRIWSGSLSQTVRQNLGMLAPALKTPVELAAGKSFFTNREFSRQESASVGAVVSRMPKPVQQWIGYKLTHDAAGRAHHTFDGERFYLLFQSWAASRLVSTSDRQFKTLANDPSVGPLLLDTLTGLRYKTLNLDDEQAKRLKERQRQLEENLVRWGEMRSFERRYAPRATP